MADLQDLQNDLNKALKVLEGKTHRIIKVEGLRFIKTNFRKEAWEGVPWAKRKTTDNRGRDITRYRTNRVGKRGDFNAYGRKNGNRAILVGHNNDTDGVHLANSFTGRIEKNSVRFITPKEYAEVHNEGSDIMPKRQFMGPSKELNKAIHKKIKKELDKALKR